MNQAAVTTEKRSRKPTLNKSNYLAPDLKNAATSERLSEQGLIPLEQIADFPYILDEIAAEIGIPSLYFNQIRSRLFFNPMLHILMPQALGGFHTVDKYIEFSQRVLTDPNAKLIIAHVFFHEYIHMIGIADEAITEMMTIRRMKAVYGQVGITSGYVAIVEELEGLIGERSFDELFDLMNREESARLNTIVSEIVLTSVFDNPNKGQGLMDNISISNLMNSARHKWAYIMQLFPRLINEVGERDVHQFEPAIMSWYELNKPQIEEALAEQLLFNPKRAVKVLNLMFENTDDEERKLIMSSDEYQYIFAFAEKYKINLYTWYDSLSRQLYGGYEM